MTRAGGLTPAVWVHLVHRWWKVPPKETALFWRALSRSEYTEPRALRQQLALVTMGMNEPIHFIHQTISPQNVLKVLEALCHERRLPRPVVTRISESILRHVSATGTWL